MDNSIRQTPKEHCLPLAPVFDSLVGHHSYTDTYYWSQKCVSLQRFQPLVEGGGGGGSGGFAPPGNLTNLISLKRHFLHFDTAVVFDVETG